MRPHPRQKFEAQLPLRPGINFVTVVARESNEVASHKSFIVRRDGQDGRLLDTPKSDEDAVCSGSCRSRRRMARSEGAGTPLIKRNWLNDMPARTTTLNVLDATSA